MNIILSKVLFAAAFFSPATLVTGHGYMRLPGARNYVARGSNFLTPINGTPEPGGQGTWGSAPGVPKAESTPHGVNQNLAMCGISTQDYDEWIDSMGTPMPWISQEKYVQGQTIRIEILLTAHHKGHFVFKACPKGRASTQDCLDSHPLEYVREITPANMPKDENHPERVMLAGISADPFAVLEAEFAYEMKLPDDLVGEEVLIQWVWRAGNSAIWEGYPEYESMYGDVVPPGTFGGDNTMWYEDQTSIINPPAKPEHFINCAEVTVLPSDGSFPATPPPVTVPIVPPPVSAPVPAPVSVPTATDGSPVYVPPPVASPVYVPPPVPDGGGGAATCASGYTGFMPYNGCKQFYQCSNGAAHPVQSCPPGLLFNVNMNACDWDYNVSCDESGRLLRSF